MGLYHGDKRDAVAKLGKALEAKGWKLYGWHDDRSDMQTDYFCPAYWEGVATKGDLVLCVDVGEWRRDEGQRGGRERYESAQGGTCDRCNGSKVEAEAWSIGQARLDPQGFHADRRRRGLHAGVMLFAGVVSPLIFHDEGECLEKCEHCSGTGFSRRVTTVFEPWPKFQPNPKHRQWHLEHEGVILASGAGVFSTRDDDAKRAKLVDKIEREAAPILAQLAEERAERSPVLCPSHCQPEQGQTLRQHRQAVAEAKRGVSRGERQIAAGLEGFAAFAKYCANERRIAELEGGLTIEPPGYKGASFGVPTARQKAEADLVAVIRVIGPGFHPDNRGDDYSPPLPSTVRSKYDLVIEAAIAAGVDVYAVSAREVRAKLREQVASSPLFPEETRPAVGDLVTYSDVNLREYRGFVVGLDYPQVTVEWHLPARVLRPCLEHASGLRIVTQRTAAPRLEAKEPPSSTTSAAPSGTLAHEADTEIPDHWEAL